MHRLDKISPRCWYHLYFLKASHLGRTRHAHQVTVAALTQLQRQAFSLAGDLENFSRHGIGIDPAKSNVSVLGQSCLYSTHNMYICKWLWFYH